MAQSAPSASGLIGRTAAFQEMLELVARVGSSQAAVLLLGESGTGKELVARAIHEASTRASGPLVVVDCARLPETLFESELFGHEKGAFTGAQAAKSGLVEAASGGTLFLDEVGDIPLPMQVKLLRLLESGTYRRVGCTEPRRADVRLVSATHRDLQTMVTDGRFREDLYYRLSTFPIDLPPLRERQGDIPLLVTSLLSRVAPTRRLSLAAEPGRADAAPVARCAGSGAPEPAPVPGQRARVAQCAGALGPADGRRCDSRGNHRAGPGCRPPQGSTGASFTYPAGWGGCEGARAQAANASGRAAQRAALHAALASHQGIRQD